LFLCLSLSALVLQPSSSFPGDKKLHPANEFGGPLGALLGFIFLPGIVYYFWLCLEFHNGALLYPTSVSDLGRFVTVEVYEPFVRHALPTTESLAIYTFWFVWQWVLAAICPGPEGYGAVLSDGKTRLKYRFNGAFVWVCTLILVISLQLSGYFSLSRLYDNYAALLTTASIFATALSAACHIGALIYNQQERMSGNLVYDYFMGAILNPRIGNFDIKFWAEIRPGIMLWFFMTCSCAVKQYELYGFVTLPMLFMCFYHLCYANACYKGEECIPMSMDIIYEKFGWMLCWANLVWVPFTYCFPAYYLLKIEPFEPAWYWSAFVLLLHISGYYMFDTANSQKDYFRADFPGKQLDGKQQNEHHGRGFPRLPWGRLPKETVTYIQTKRGTKLLTSGWWGLARYVSFTLSYSLNSCSLIYSL